MNVKRMVLRGSTWRDKETSELHWVTGHDQIRGEFVLRCAGDGAVRSCPTDELLERYEHVPAKRTFTPDSRVDSDLPEVAFTNEIATTFKDGTIADTQALNEQQAAKIAALPVVKVGQIYRNACGFVRLVTSVDGSDIKYVSVYEVSLGVASGDRHTTDPESLGELVCDNIMEIGK